MVEPSQNFTSLELFFKSLVTTSEAYNFIPTIFSMLINIFHVFILSRSSIQSSAVNIILLGIGIVDILSPLIYIKMKVNSLSEDKNCKLPSTHLQVIIDWIFYAIRDDFRRCSVWLGLFLVIIRTISLKMVTQKNFNFINSSKTGRSSILIVVLISSIFSICYIFRYQIIHLKEPWVPEKGCPDLLPIDSCLRFPHKIVEITDSPESRFDGTARLVHLVLTAILEKIIPSILFPIFGILLILELRKKRKSRKFSKLSDTTNQLVVYMTITFIIIELPIGICKLITATRDTYEEAIIPESISKLLNIIYVSMTATHCFICFAMSSQYRKTVKNVLRVPQKVLRNRMFSKFSNT